MGVPPGRGLCRKDSRVQSHAGVGVCMGTNLVASTDASLGRGPLGGFLSRESPCSAGVPPVGRALGQARRPTGRPFEADNYSQSRGLVQYSIDRFTLATWSQAPPSAPIPHGTSLVLKGPPSPGLGGTTSREGQSPASRIPQEQELGGLLRPATLLWGPLCLSAPAELHNKPLPHWGRGGQGQYATLSLAFSGGDMRTPTWQVQAESI